MTVNIKTVCFCFAERSCLSVRLSLRRAIGHHLVQSYLPSILIVVISWVSFWLDVDAIPARVTLGVTTLLTISAESSDKQVSFSTGSYLVTVFLLLLLAVPVCRCNSQKIICEDGSQIPREQHVKLTSLMMWTGKVPEQLS